jgi:plastocyanin
MKKLAVAAVPLLLVVALAVGGCGKPVGGQSTPTGPSNQVNMDATNFVEHTVTIKAGQAVIFNDPADTGGTHVNCLGTNETCNASATGPTELKDPGFTITPGQTKSVTFSQPGTYQVTCTVHPNMNLTVTVQ